MAWRLVDGAETLPPEGGVMAATVDDVAVAVYRLGGTFYATSNICTHQRARLSEGFVEGGCIECPLHQGRFDIRTGKARGAPVTENLATYAVKQEGGKVYVDVSRSAAAESPEASAPVATPARRERARAGRSRAEGRQTMPRLSNRYVWPEAELAHIPDWVYTDPYIYELEVEKIFHGPTWNYVALEAEVAAPGDFVRSWVGPTPVVVARDDDGGINVFVNRCGHRASEFCREQRGNATEFVCPYHQWAYDLKGNLTGVPFRRGLDGRGGLPADFDADARSPRRLNVTTRRGVVFASFTDDMPSLEDYLGERMLAEFDATFDGRRLTLLGYYRNTVPGNWKLYHENLKDPYHATLLHTFLVTFGLVVPGNRSEMICDPTGLHGAIASAKQNGVDHVSEEARGEMRAFRPDFELKAPQMLDFIDEFDSPWSVTMQTIWPNFIVQRELNTLGVRQIVPRGPHEFQMNWTMFGFEGDDDAMLRHRLRQGNLMGPAGFLGIEDNEAMKFVQDGMKRSLPGDHLVALEPENPAGGSDCLISESAIRAMYKSWREALEIG